MRVNRRLLYVVTWLTDFSGLLLIFAVSRDLAEQGASLAKMGAVGGVLSLMFCVSGIVFGRLSDRVGRRRVVFLGMTLLVVGCGGYLVLAVDSWGYYVSYWLSGLGMGMVHPPLVAWLNQGREDDERGPATTAVLIRYCVGWNFGVIGGQMAGGWLFPLGLRWPMAAALGLAVVNLGLVLATGKWSSKPKASPAGLGLANARHRAISSGFARMNWIANLGGAFSMSMILHLFPQLAVNLHVPSELHGTIVVAMRVAVIGVYLLMYRSQFWHYRFSVPLVAQASGLAGLGVLLVARGPMGLIVGLMGLAVLLGYNYFAGLYYSTTSRGDEQRGAVSGMHEGTLALGFAAGSMGGGIVGTLAGGRAPYVLGMCVIVVLAAIQIAVYVRWVRGCRFRIDD